MIFEDLPDARLARTRVHLLAEVLVIAVLAVLAGADGTVTLARRSARREKVWQAHRSHFYQRLVQLGWGHRKTVLWEYALMVGCAGAGLGAMRASATAQALLISLCLAAYLAIALGVTALERRRPHPSAKSVSK